MEYFRRSTDAAKKLRAMQTQLETTVSLKLILDVVTKWNSTYFMFKRICDIQDQLIAAIRLFHNHVQSLTETQWKIVKQFTTILVNLCS